MEKQLAEKLEKITRRLEERKGEKIVSIDLEGQGAFTEALLILTATSARHGRSLADSVAELCREQPYEFSRMEGYDVGQWILVDMNDVVINIFLEPAREIYRLESLWGYARPAQHIEVRS
jgi:ribosome-associated protein